MAECSGVWVGRLQKLGWGRMFVVRTRVPSPYPNEKWGFDNGAYRDWVRGESFNEKAYWKSLDKILKVGIPQMAVLPDIVAAGQQSLDFSYSWLDRLPHHFPWYLAVQDGMKATDIDVTSLSGIFLGGTNKYKATAADWVKFAHENQLKFHYGRCGTRNKLAHALHIGADSLDSALPLMSRARFKVFKEDVINGPQQTDLFWNGGSQ